MDYGRLIGRAWTTTWRHRFLWVLGLFATTTVGTCTLGGGGGSQARSEVGPEAVEPAAPEVGEAGLRVGQWLAENPGVVAAAVVLFVALALALVFVSLVAQGGMATATADLARGQATALAPAWQAGSRLWLRYLALWLLLVALAVAFALVIGAVVAALLIGLGGPANGALGAVRALLLLIVGLPALLVGLALAIVVSVVVAYAQRIIALDDVGAVEAVRRGWRLFRARLGQSLLAWLISLALSIGAGLAIAVGVVLVALLLGGLGLALFVLAGLSPLVVAYGVLAALLLVAAAWLLAAIANTFFWSFWTLVYLELSGGEPAVG